MNLQNLLNSYCELSKIQRTIFLMDELDQNIIKAEQELNDLNERRKEILERILLLKQKRDLSTNTPILTNSPNEIININSRSSEKVKIDLFRSLFKGREDVFPKRFENIKTGKSGYQPACYNEWICA